MNKTPAQRFAFKAAFRRDQRLARNIAQGNKSAPLSKAEARTIAEQAAAEQPITRVEPKAPQKPRA